MLAQVILQKLFLELGEEAAFDSEPITEASAPLSTETIYVRYNRLRDNQETLEVWDDPDFQGLPLLVLSTVFETPHLDQGDVKVSDIRSSGIMATSEVMEFVGRLLLRLAWYAQVTSPKLPFK